MVLSRLSNPQSSIKTEFKKRTLTLGIGGHQPYIYVISADSDFLVSWSWLPTWIYCNYFFSTLAMGHLEFDLFLNGLLNYYVSITKLSALNYLI